MATTGVPANGNMRGLNGLPEELLTNIGHRLSSDDVFALRLCCRATEHKTFHEFATRFFPGKCIHFTTDSLQVLVNISKSRLADYVKSVSIMTAFFSELSFKDPRCHHAARWTPNVRQSEAYRFYIRDQQDLMDSGRDMLMLSDAFKSLKKLSSVAMIDFPPSESSETQYWGFWKVSRLTGIYPVDGTSPADRTESKEYRKWIGHVWLMLLRALANSHGHITLNEFKTTMSLSDNSIFPRQLKLSKSTSSKLSEVLKTTTRFQLHLKGYRSFADAKKHGDTATQFARIMPNVTNLKLYMDSSDHTGYVFRKLISGFDCENMQLFEINSLLIDIQPLINVFSRFKKIEDLRLVSVDLMTGSWPQALKVIEKFDAIEHLHLMYLKEAGAKAYFLRQPTRDELRILRRQKREIRHDGPYGHTHPHNIANFDVEDDEYDGFEDMDEDSDISSEDLPELEPVNGQPANVESHSAEGASVSGAADPTKDASSSMPPEDITAEGTEHHVPDMTSLVEFGERGFYVCLKDREEVLHKLPLFIKEYSLGEPIDEMGMPFGAGVAPFVLPAGVMGGGVIGGGAGGGGPPMPPGGPPLGPGGGYNVTQMMNALFGGAPIPGGPGPGPPPPGNPGAAAGAQAQPAPSSATAAGADDDGSEEDF